MKSSGAEYFKINVECTINYNYTKLDNSIISITTIIKINVNSNFNSITNEELEWKCTRILEMKKYFI